MSTPPPPRRDPAATTGVRAGGDAGGALGGGGRGGHGSAYVCRGSCQILLAGWSRLRYVQTIPSTTPPCSITLDSYAAFHAQILVDKIWALLLKSKLVQDPDAEEEGACLQSSILTFATGSPLVPRCPTDRALNLPLHNRPHSPNRPCGPGRLRALWTGDAADPPSPPAPIHAPQVFEAGA
jgi:hypothetical protein